MRACVLHAQEDLRLDSLPIGEPGAGEVRVRIGAGGICGSDLHYYFHGGFGTVRLRQPMILGHEVADTIDAIGAGVTRVKPGDRIALNPSRPCGHCGFCLQGRANHCLDMRFYGSAMRFPHVQGAFAEALIADEAQCFTVDPDITVGQAAFGEPLAVALHAVNRAGALLGKRVLVTGAGPIGSLTVAAARLAGAGEIVAIDIVDATLVGAARMGANLTINVAAAPEAMAVYEKDKGYFDVVFEASGSAKAVAQAIAVAKPRGILVQIGVGGETPVPLNLLVAKEIDWRGTFRFHEEFALAVDCIARGAIDVLPLLTETVPIEEAARAFALASDRNRAIKVHLGF
jgi:L-idonate 5-dehydrogenase